MLSELNNTSGCVIITWQRINGIRHHQFWSPLFMTEEVRHSFSLMDQGSEGPSSNLCSVQTKLRIGLRWHYMISCFKQASMSTWNTTALILHNAVTITAECKWHRRTQSKRWMNGLVLHQFEATATFCLWYHTQAWQSTMLSGVFCRPKRKRQYFLSGPFNLLPGVNTPIAVILMPSAKDCRVYLRGLRLL